MYTIIRLLIKLLSVYSLLIVIKCLLPLFTRVQNKWTVLLDKVCAPAIAIGRQVAQRVFKGRTFAFDIGPIAAALLIWLVQFVLSIFF